MNSKTWQTKTEMLICQAIRHLNDFYSTVTKKNQQPQHRAQKVIVAAFRIAINSNSRDTDKIRFILRIQEQSNEK